MSGGSFRWRNENVILGPRQGAFAANPAKPAHDQRAHRDQRPQAPPGGPLCKKGGRGVAPLHRGSEHPCLMPGHLGGDLPPVIDHGGHAGVGGPHHGPLKLQAAHAGNVQVLIDGDGVAKPRDVADVDQHRGCALGVDKATGQLFPKQVFITNVGRNPMALPIKSGRVVTACFEVAQWHVHPIGEPAKHGRHKLSKRHQMVFVVGIVV